MAAAEFFFLPELFTVVVRGPFSVFFLKSRLAKLFSPILGFSFSLP